ncbi:helix-turn-helix domain-containing protein [Corynebacterium sp. S7]
MTNVEERRKIIGAKLRNARQAMNQTQEWVAEQSTKRGATMGPSVIAKIESGKRGLEITEAQTLSDVLNIPWSALYIPANDGEELPIERLQRLAAGTLGSVPPQLESLADKFGDLSNVLIEWNELEEPYRLTTDSINEVDQELKEVSKALEAILKSTLQIGGALNVGTGVEINEHGEIINPPALFIQPLWQRIEYNEVHRHE